MTGPPGDRGDPGRFTEIYGRPADGRWAAPGRVNLIGEYTDLNEGFVLPIAIDRRTRVEAAARGDRRLAVSSVQRSAGAIASAGSAGSAALVVDLDDDRASPSGWAAYPLAVARALRRFGHDPCGADILVDGDVPIGAGLSSSAALECAVGSALCDLSGIELDPLSLARVAQVAENDYVGVPCGLMDQAASMCCRAGYALLFDTRSLELTQLPFDLAAAGLALLVVDTQVKHSVGTSAYADRRRACERAAELLSLRALRDVPAAGAEEALDTLRRLGGDVLARRARHVLSEQERVLRVAALLEAGRIEEIGPVLSDGHRSLRDDLEVSCPELDTVVEAACEAGAHGARMTGAGFGGSAIVLVAEREAEVVTEAVRRALAIRGYGEPSCFAVTAADGACREA